MHQGEGLRPSSGTAKTLRAFVASSKSQLSINISSNLVSEHTSDTRDHRNADYHNRDQPVNKCMLIGMMMYDIFNEDQTIMMT